MSSAFFLTLREAVRVGAIRLKWKIFQFAESYGIDPRTPGLVSVLVPTLEERHELLGSRCLASIASQSYSNLEVLIVTESFSADVEKTVNQFDSRFRYLWGAKQSRKLKEAGPLAIWCSGAAPGLNLALRSSRGAYLARLDDDDAWLPDHIKNGLQVMQVLQADFVSSHALNPSGGLVGLNEMTSPYFGRELVWCRPSVSVGTPITWIFKSHLRSFKFNEKSWKKQWNKPVDLDFLLRTGAGGVKFAFTEQVTAKYMARPGLNGLTGSRAYLKEQGSDLLGDLDS